MLLSLEFLFYYHFLEFYIYFRLPESGICGRLRITLDFGAKTVELFHILTTLLATYADIGTTEIDYRVILLVKNREFVLRSAQ